ncbi:Leucine-rich repeat receptor protein kinase EXS [Hordeum vulgare]|uniref:Protein kinase domain-containing protein n=2 Tax=Hordeum vulgare subsp. vulgare TaxID=112509 RepID=A0A8I6XMX6_HORVV|nr:Leucine-rich repeat receptor protein kinase EXS [Hordeum vulgare]
MACARFVALAVLAVVCHSLFGLASAADDGELRALLEFKAALDPTGRLLPSWAPGRDPCARGGFEGVACDALGAVANVSLQGKGLAGTLSPAVAGLRALTGLYLHYNELRGGVPPELAKLTRLTDVYLNVNNFSGPIPAEIGAMASLQVLQLCYNQLTGSIPTQLGLLNRLAVLALQSNHLNGAIPASLGDLPELRRLDLSFNNLFGSIPVRLARLPQLAALDVRNNSLTGSVPSELAKLEGGFQYGNNTDLCGTGLPDLRPCTPADLIDPDRPQPFSAGIAPQIKPGSSDRHCSGTHCPPSTKALAAVVIVAVILLGATAAGLLVFSWHRWRKQRRASGAGAPPMTTVGGRCSIEGEATKESFRKSASSTLVSLEYSNGWDPLADGRSGVGFSQEVSPSFRFNMEEVESATHYFSELNLMGKKTSRSKSGAGSSFAATYRGTLRDGTPVVVTRLGKTCCKQEEAEFLKGLKLLAELRHDNIVGLRGFCCSRARGECFLVHDFVPNGSLSHFLDVAGEDGGGGALGHGGRVLEWSTRVSIIKGIAKGIGYLHSTRANKLPLVHQNISADKVLVDYTYKPLISGSGLHKLLVDDLVFSTLKASAAMGYLAPEYTTVGRFSEKSDVYAFGVIVFQILTGKSKTMQLPFETGNVHDLIDGNMKGCYSATEAAKLAKIALVCTSENPEQRPTMEELVQELDTL